MRDLLAILLLSSAALAAQAPAGTRLRTIQIEFLPFDAAQAAGKRSTSPFAVRLTGPDGAPVVGARVSFRFLPGPASGRFAGGLSSEIAVTDAAGVAEAGHVHWDAQPGPVRLQVIAAVGELRAERVESLDLLPPRSSSARLRPGGRTFWAIVGSAAVSTLAGLAWAKK